jgi:hypothetical protein
VYRGRDATNLKTIIHKLFGAQRRRETAKPIAIFGVVETMFDCDGNSRR